MFVNVCVYVCKCGGGGWCALVLHESQCPPGASTGLKRVGLSPRVQ